MKKLISKYSAVGMTLSLGALPMLAKAQSLGQEDILPSTIASDLGQGDQDIRTTIAGVIRAFMGLLGLVAVIIILWGGFNWMTAGGDEGKVDEAKKRIIAGVIGLIIILSAYAIASFVIGAILTGTGG